jgi:hypothetical protein
MGFSQKTKNELPCNPSIPFLGIYPKESNKHTHIYCSTIVNAKYGIILDAHAQMNG